MALFNCPECKKEISDKAKSCPNCGYEVNPKLLDKKKLTHKKSSGSGCAILIMVISVIFFIFYLIGTSSDDNSNDNSKSSSGSTNNFLAYNYAENFVKKKLKSPGTAEFPGTFEKADHITELGNNKYKIISWVDSQNSFGATIRTKFSCLIEFKGNEVSCTDLQLYE